MSAPLVVNTTDGTCWVRRAVTRDGSGLYALAGSVAGCPDEVLASLAELAEHGIVGSADALPMPVGPEPSELERLRIFADATTARHEAIRDLLGPVSITSPDAWDLGMSILAILDGPGEGGPTADQRINDLKAQLAAKGQSIQAMVGERTKLLSRVAELEAERHVTNEALDDAVQCLRERQAEREVLVERLRAGQRWQRGRAPELVSENLVSQSELREIFGIPLLPPWDGADGITRLLAPSQALREVPDGEHAAWVRHDYRTSHDLPETGGAPC